MRIVAKLINAARKGVQLVKDSAGKVAAAVAVGYAATVATTQEVAAQTTPAFDYTEFSTTATSGLSTIGAVAAGIAAIAAGVMIWKKIKGYFNKAG